MSPKVISLNHLEYINIVKKFSALREFEDAAGLRLIGERILHRDNKKTYLLLFRVLDSKKLLYARIKYEF